MFEEAARVPINTSESESDFLGEYEQTTTTTTKTTTPATTPTATSYELHNGAAALFFIHYFIFVYPFSRSLFLLVQLLKFS